MSISFPLKNALDACSKLIKDDQASFTEVYLYSSVWQNNHTMTKALLKRYFFSVVIGNGISMLFPSIQNFGILFLKN